MQCRLDFLLLYLIFASVKLENCNNSIDLNKVADWANNLQALKKNDEEKWNLLQNSLEGMN